MKALARHLGSCSARLFPRGFLLDDHSYTYLANRNRRLERGIETWLVDIASSRVATLEQRSTLTRGGLALLVHMHFIRDVKVTKADPALAAGVEPPGRLPTRDFSPPPARSTGPAFLGLPAAVEAAPGAAARVEAPAQDEAPVTAAELAWAEELERRGKITPIVRGVRDGTLSPSVFRRYLKRMGCPLPPG